MMEGVGTTSTIRFHGGNKPVGDGLVESLAVQGGGKGAGMSAGLNAACDLEGVEGEEEKVGRRRSRKRVLGGGESMHA